MKHPTSVPQEDTKDREAFQQVLGEWNRLRKKHGGRGVKLQRSNGLGQHLAARIDEHGPEAMARMMVWFHESGHQRALFLRKRGTGLSTLTRPGKCADYIQFAYAPRAEQQVPDGSWGAEWMDALDGVDDEPAPKADPSPTAWEEQTKDWTDDDWERFDAANEF